MQWPRQLRRNRSARFDVARRPVYLHRENRNAAHNDELQALLPRKPLGLSRLGSQDTLAKAGLTLMYDGSPELWSCSEEHPFAMVECSGEPELLRDLRCAARCAAGRIGSDQKGHRACKT